MQIKFKLYTIMLALMFVYLPLNAKGRARDMEVEFRGCTGYLNALTDVPGVTVGYSTIVKDDPKPVRTGVSAIFPRGYDSFSKPVYGSSFVLNGNGEMTGSVWLEESGIIDAPIMVTNTNSVGMVHHSLLKWANQNGYEFDDLPIVAETWDGQLNDIRGQHVKEEHVFEALESACGGPVGEGNIGSGTGMVCYRFKGGIGTSSRIVRVGEQDYTIGVWVQANHGLKHHLIVDGVALGEELADDSEAGKEYGSIIIIVATDAPLMPQQLKRLAKRAALGLARTGAIGANSSGDIFLAFSTGNVAKVEQGDSCLMKLKSIENGAMDPLFEGTIQATEESIINALVAAETMTGVDGCTIEALDVKKAKEVMGRYGR